LVAQQRSQRPAPAVAPPRRPIGAKLELTYACNLRCGFCYTDSPRHTLQRTPELGDEQWRALVHQCLDLGIIEAVVTGGEPLLRRELTLELVEEMAGAGVGVTLNTNGWFVDEDVAQRLGRAPGLVANVSLDGSRPGLHDGSRGVPGSWRRAVAGIDNLLCAGAGVCVSHIVSPGNAAEVGDFLLAMTELGVPYVRVIEVIPVGAAARGGDWAVDSSALRDAVTEFCSRSAVAPRVTLVPADACSVAEATPRSLLIRPNGDVRTDSVRPFAYGNAIEEGLGACWDAIRLGWNGNEVRTWAAEIGGPEDLPKASTVPYLDPELPLAGAPAGNFGGRGLPTIEPVRRDSDPALDRREAADQVRALVLARRYRREPVRLAGDDSGRYLRRASDGGYIRINESASSIIEMIDGSTLADASEELRSRFGVDRARAEADAIEAIAELQRLRVVAPAKAADGPTARGPGTADLPGGWGGPADKPLA
jgi:MoaA/NifB/PqqE/SkfB family radical SAM enzyme